MAKTPTYLWGLWLSDAARWYEQCAGTVNGVLHWRPVTFFTKRDAALYRRELMQLSPCGPFKVQIKKLEPK